MKEKIKKYWLVIFIVIIIGGAFYWFQWRPSEIRKECYSNSLDRFVGGTNIDGSPSLRMNSNSTFYMNCLRGHGLEK